MVVIVMWVEFFDMCSGGFVKQPPYDRIYIEAKSEAEASIIFFNRFGHSPDRVTCLCCGEDYSVYSEESLEDLTEYDRRGCSLVEHAERDGVLIIRSDEVRLGERKGEVPVRGQLWGS